MGEEMGYSRSLLLLSRIFLIVFGMSSVHLLGYIDQLGYSAFVFVDAVFVANFWFVFFSYCALSSAFGAFFFYIIKGPFTLTASYFVDKVFKPSERRNLRVFVAAMRRGWWDFPIIAYFSFSHFVYVYIDAGFVWSFLYGLLPLFYLRTSMHAGDSFLFVASRAIRRNGARRFLKKDSDKAIDKNKNDWRSYWRGAEEWADRRTFSLSTTSVYVLLVLLAVTANRLGHARATSLMAKANIEFESKSYADVGQNSVGVVVFESASKEISIVPESEIKVKSTGQHGLITFSFSVRWLSSFWQNDGSEP